MSFDFNGKVHNLKKSGKTFATAVVTRHEPPSSGKTGDKAIILPNGKILGWIGGGCTQPVVINESKNALQEGKSKYIRISPERNENIPPGIIEYFMTCHSGGSIDVFIEPVLPNLNLIIMGKSYIAQSLAKLAKILNYNVSVVSKNADPILFGEPDNVYDQFDLSGIDVSDRAFIVVATQGDYDEEALTSALELKSNYISFVASRRKFNSISEYLQLQGISTDVIDRVKTPAGIDINAKQPEEVAVSILAEIIKIKQQASSLIEHLTNEKESQQSVVSIDPVCKMSVKVDETDYSIDHGDDQFFFCSANCKEKFTKEPKKYLELLH